jgi:hypothetical protein
MQPASPYPANVQAFLLRSVSEMKDAVPQYERIIGLMCTAFFSSADFRLMGNTRMHDVWRCSEMRVCYTGQSLMDVLKRVDTIMHGGNCTIEWAFGNVLRVKTPAILVDILFMSPACNLGRIVAEETSNHPGQQILVQWHNASIATPLPNIDCARSRFMVLS